MARTLDFINNGLDRLFLWEQTLLQAVSGDTGLPPKGKLCFVSTMELKFVTNFSDCLQCSLSYIFSQTLDCLKLYKYCEFQSLQNWLISPISTGRNDPNTGIRILEKFEDFVGSIERITYLTSKVLTSNQYEVGTLAPTQTDDGVYVYTNRPSVESLLENLEKAKEKTPIRLKVFNNVIGGIKRSIFESMERFEKEADLKDDDHVSIYERMSTRIATYETSANVNKTWLPGKFKEGLPQSAKEHLEAVRRLTKFWELIEQKFGPDIKSAEAPKVTPRTGLRQRQPKRAYID